MISPNTREFYLNQMQPINNCAGRHLNRKSIVASAVAMAKAKYGLIDNYVGNWSHVPQGQNEFLVNEQEAKELTEQIMAQYKKAGESWYYNDVTPRLKGINRE